MKISVSMTIHPDPAGMEDMVVASYVQIEEHGQWFGMLYPDPLYEIPLSELLEFIREQSEMAQRIGAGFEMDGVVRYFNMIVSGEDEAVLQFEAADFLSEIGELE